MLPIWELRRNEKKCFCVLKSPGFIQAKYLRCWAKTALPTVGRVKEPSVFCVQRKQNDKKNCSARNTRGAQLFFFVDINQPREVCLVLPPSLPAVVYLLQFVLFSFSISSSSSSHSTFDSNLNPSPSFFSLSLHLSPTSLCVVLCVCVHLKNSCWFLVCMCVCFLKQLVS